MRIPVSNSDLNQGRLTKIARALQKALPGEPMGLMRAQNALAALLGYRDLHDLQSITQKGAVTPLAPGLSRSKIINSVAWKLNRHHGVALLPAAEIASKLHLKMLEVDAQTADAATERWQKEIADQGKLLVSDEYASLMDSHWNPNTPRLLDANIPGYSFAVLPNKSVFRWSLLHTLLERLPDDFMTDLVDDPKYKHYGDDEARGMAFVSSEIYPQACRSMLEATKNAEIRPNGYEIKWLFADGGDYIGNCIGRVLFNKALGGIIPVIYRIDTDDIFGAMGALLSGETIEPDTMPADSKGQPVFVLKWHSHGGYDLAKDTRVPYPSGGNKLGAHNLERLPDHIMSHMVDGRPVLSGGSFIKDGQTYLRHQTWLLPQEVPSSIASVIEIKPFQGSYLNATGAVPALASELFAFADDRRRNLFTSACAQIRTEEGIERLTSLLHQLIAPEALDAYCNALISEDWPLRYEDDTEDRQDLLEDRTEGIGKLAWNGQQVKAVIPALAPFEDQTIGLLLFRAHGQSVDGRNNWVYPPATNDVDEIAHIVCAMVLHAVVCVTGRKTPYVEFNPEVLAFVVSCVLDGLAEPTGVVNAYFEVAEFCQKLEDQKKFVRAMSEWMDSESAMAQLRSRGQFLYVGSPISREKPKGLADLFAMSRSAGFTTLLVEQSTEDFAALANADLGSRLGA